MLNMSMFKMRIHFCNGVVGFMLIVSVVDSEEFNLQIKNNKFTKMEETFNLPATFSTYLEEVEGKEKEERERKKRLFSERKEESAKKKKKTEVDFNQLLESDGDDDSCSDDEYVRKLSSRKKTSKKDKTEKQSSKAPSSNPTKEASKFRWTNEMMADLVDLILSSEQFKKYLIFENNKRANTAYYEALVEGLNQRISKYDVEMPGVTVTQARNKFKSLVGEVKAITLTKKTASGIDRSRVERGYGDWFTRLYEVVSSRPSFDPSNIVEPGFTEGANAEENTETANSATQTPTKRGTKFVPTRSTKTTSTKRNMQQSILDKIDKIIENDKTNDILNLIKEENEKARQHESLMMDKLLQVLSPPQQSAEQAFNRTPSSVPRYAEGYQYQSHHYPALNSPERPISTNTQFQSPTFVPRSHLLSPTHTYVTPPNLQSPSHTYISRPSSISPVPYRPYIQTTKASKDHPSDDSDDY